MTITKDDLSLAIYGEITEQISRGSDALLDTKISIGRGEVESYLNRFDTDAMFGTDWQNDFFKALCVNVIAWQLVIISNPNINMDLLRQSYEDAIKYLEKVQKGTVKPNWPLRPNDPDTNIDDAGNIQWSSNSKRNNHF